MVVVFLLLSCISLQAQMYIGKDAIVTLEGVSSITSDSIIIESGSNVKKDLTVKKSGTLYLLTSSEQAPTFSETSTKLAKADTEKVQKNKAEFLGEEKSRKISRAPVPNPKPQISYSSTSRDNFKLKAEQRAFALAANQLTSGKKSVATSNFKDKSTTLRFSPAKEKHTTLSTGKNVLSVYLNSFRSRPPPRSA